MISGKSKDLDCDLESKDKDTVHLVATPVPLHLALEVPTWDTRGWILQERLLSRRCLYFTDRYVYFQCGREVASESGINQPLCLKSDDLDESGKATFAAPTARQSHCRSSGARRIWAGVTTFQELHRVHEACPEVHNAEIII